MGNSQSSKKKKNNKSGKSDPTSSSSSSSNTNVTQEGSTRPSGSPTHNNGPSHNNPQQNSSSQQSFSRGDTPTASKQGNTSLKSEGDKLGFSPKRVEELFEKYKDPDAPQIGPAGVELLCRDLGVEPEDVLLLVFAWHLNAQSMGYFRKEEFTAGLQKLGVDSIPKLKNQLSLLKNDLDDPVKFKEIYRYAFNFAKEKDQKILDLAMADAVLGLVLGSRFPHGEAFRQFLTEQTSYKSVNQDQWLSILEFCKTIKPDLSNYDENGAWPVLLDEFTEWKRVREEERATS